MDADVHELCKKLSDFESYVEKRRILTNQKIPVTYKNRTVMLTQRQLKMLKLVSIGLSNVRVAAELNQRESTVKLMIYRLMKYLESVTYQKIDRFYLIVVAQEIILKHEQKAS